MATVKYETDFTGYEQLNSKYRINKQTGKIINKHNRFVKMNPETRKRDYSFVKDNHKKRRNIRSINQDTQETAIYRSMYACAKDTGINTGLVKLCCECADKVVTAKDNQRYKFEFTTQEPTKEVTRALVVYTSKEDRINADRERMRKYGKRRKHCECGNTYARSGRVQHKRTQQHKNYMSQRNNIKLLFAKGDQIIEDFYKSK